MRLRLESTVYNCVVVCRAKLLHVPTDRSPIFAAARAACRFLTLPMMELTLFSTSSPKTCETHQNFNVRRLVLGCIKTKFVERRLFQACSTSTQPHVQSSSVLALRVWAVCSLFLSTGRNPIPCYRIVALKHFFLDFKHFFQHLSNFLQKIAYSVI